METTKNKYPYSKTENNYGKVIALQTTKGAMPPNAIDLEKAILGALMIDARGADDLFQVFSNEEVFYKNEHKLIFRAIKTLAESSKQIDILTVVMELKAQQLLEEVGGEVYLISLTQAISSSAHIEYHAYIVLQQFMRRKIIEICNNVVTNAFDDSIDVFSLLDQIDTELALINDVVSKGKTDMTFAEALEQVKRNVEVLSCANEGEITGTRTGFAKLDKHFGGWQPSDFVVIGGRPSMGKTAWAMSTMIGAAKSGAGVGFISLEMSTVQLAIRAVAVNSNYHLNQLTKTGFDKDSYFIGLNNKINEMKPLPIYIDERPALSINEIKRKARLMKRKYDIKVLIVDYIQLAGGDDEDIRKRTGKTSQGLKALAKELSITVIGLAQLSRAVESTPTKRPALHHLKESGDIEQDADIVAFLYRPEYYNLQGDATVLSDGTNTEFIISKYRQGGTGTVGLYYDTNKTKFSDVSLHDVTADPFSNVTATDPFDAFSITDDSTDLPDWLK